MKTKLFYLIFLFFAGVYFQNVFAAETIDRKNDKKNEITEGNGGADSKTPAEDSKALPFDKCDPCCLPPITLLPWIGPDIDFLLTGVAVAGYSIPEGDDGSFSLDKFNPIFLFSYKDCFFFRGSVTFSINDQGGTDVSLDFANLNWFMNDYVAFGIGKFDSGVGQFVQSISPEWINKLPTVPVGFDADEAAPQSDIGIRFQGGLPLCYPSEAYYIVFLSNGPRAFVDTSLNVIDHIGTDGFTTNNTGNYVGGGRFGFLPIPQVEIGISGSVGRAALIDLADEITILENSRHYTAVGADMEFQFKGFQFRSEIIRQQVDAKPSSDIAPLESEWMAWYCQLSYRICNSNFEPVVRYGRFETPFEEDDIEQWAYGVDYWFTPSIVLKLAYEVNHGQQGTDNDQDIFLVQFAFGF